MSLLRALFAAPFLAALAAACTSFEGANPPAADSGDAGSEAGGPTVVPPSPPDGGRVGLPPGLLAHWRFEGSGADVTGSDERIFTPENAVYVPGVVGLSLGCPNGGSATTLAGSVDIGAGDFTILGWALFGPRVTGDGYRTILFKGVNWSTSFQNDSGYGLGYNDDAKVLTGVVRAGTAELGYADAKANTSLIGTGFHAFAMVVRGSALAVQLDDGALDFVAFQREVDIRSDQPLRLCDVFSHPLEGALDELMIFSRALDVVEIRQARRAVVGR